MADIFDFRYETGLRVLKKRKDCFQLCLVLFLHLLRQEDPFHLHILRDFLQHVHKGGLSEPERQIDPLCLVRNRKSAVPDADPVRVTHVGQDTRNITVQNSVPLHFISSSASATSSFVGMPPWAPNFSVERLAAVFA